MADPGEVIEEFIDRLGNTVAVGLGEVHHPVEVRIDLEASDRPSHVQEVVPDSGQREAGVPHRGVGAQALHRRIPSTGPDGGGKPLNGHDPNGWRNEAPPAAGFLTDW